MTNLPILDLFGWLGFTGLMAFYWMLSKGRAILAFRLGQLGALMFLIIGVASWFGYAAHLPSLVLMEATIIGLNEHTIRRLRNEQG